LDSADAIDESQLRGIVAVSSRGHSLPWFSLIASIAITGVLILSGDGRLPSWPMGQSLANLDLRIYHNGINWIFE
jgi:hypothetical protein